MPDEHTVVERLEIQLGYENFVSNLRSITNAYHSTLDRLNNLGSGLGKTLSNSNKIVQDSILRLSNQVANSIQGSFSKLVVGLNTSHSEIVKIQNSMVSDQRKFDSLIKQRGEILVEQQRKLVLLEQSRKEGLITKKEAKSEIDKEANRVKDALRKIDNEIKQVQENSYANLSKLSLQSTESLAKSASFISNAIKKSTEEAAKSLNILREPAKTLEKQVLDISTAKFTIENIKKQRQELSKYLTDLDKQRIEAQKSVDIAQIAFNKQTNTQLQKQAYETYVKSRENLNGIIEQQKIATDAYRSSGNVLGQAYQRLNSSIKEVKTQIGTGYVEILNKSDATVSAFKSKFSEMAKDVSVFGTLGKDDLVKYFSQFSVLNKELTQDISQLDKFINLLKDLKTVDPGTKNLIINLSNLKNKLIEQQKGFIDTAKTAQQLNFEGPLIKSQQQITKFKQQATELFTKIKQEKDKIKSEDLSSAVGIQQGISSWKNIVGYSKQLKTLLLNLRQEITNTEKYQSKLEVEIAKTSNQEKKNAYKAYIDSVKVYLNELMGLESVYSSKFTTGKVLRTQLEGAAVDFKKSVRSQINDWSQVDKLIERMKVQYEDVRKYSKRSGDANIAMARGTKESLNQMITSFVNTRQKIQDALKSLEQLSKTKGITLNATEEIKMLKTLLREYNNYIGQVRGMLVGSTKFVDRQLGESEKLLSTRFLNAIRNFRWQVATLIYLTERALWGIKNTIVKSFEEISDYRKSIYALTASIGMAISPEIFKTTFSAIFSYSREIMDKLQAESAKTYASLEDMVMVTRSFAQAGIFPKTDEDIQKIGTLATAVKVMTEGMANEGVQMRQEIMALIEGRTRVTDTLAKSLQLFGIDIKKSIREWEVAGIDRLTGLASLLGSFAVINKHITNEYTVQVNRLETMWKWLKRIALENVVMTVAKDISNLIDSLGNISTGKLTDFGLNVVSNIKSAVIILYEMSKTIGSVLLQIFNSIADIGTNLNNIWGQGSEGLSRWSKDMLGFLTILTEIERIFKTFALHIENMAQSALTLFHYTKAVMKGGFTEGALKEWAEADRIYREAQEKYAKVGDDYSEKVKKNIELAKEFDKALNKINDTIRKNIDNQLDYGSSLINVSKIMIEIEEIGKKYKTKEEKGTEDINKIVELWTSGRVIINKELQLLEKQMLDNSKNTTKLLEDNIEQRKNEMIDAMTTIDQKVGVAIEDVSNSIKESVIVDVEQTTSLWDKFINWALGKSEILKRTITTIVPTYKPEGPAEEGSKELQNRYNNQLAETKKFNAAVAAENMRAIVSSNRQIMSQKEVLTSKSKKLDEETKKAIEDALTKMAGSAGKTLEQMYDEYMGLLDKFGSISPYEKITYDYKKHLADIDKLAVDNLFVMEHYAELQSLAQQYWLDQLKQKAEDISLSLTNYYRQIWGLEASPIQQIIEQYKKLDAEINRNKDLVGLAEEKLKSVYGELPPEIQERIDKQKELLEVIKKEFPLAEKLAIEREKIKQIIELEKKYLEIINKQAEILELSSSFQDKRIAAALKVQTSYIEWYRNQEEQLNKLRRTQITEFEREQLKQYEEIFEKSNILAKEALEEQKREIYYPFYKDLKDMQENWADSMSRTFTDILFDATDWQTKILNLIKEISAQLVTSFVKTNFFQPLLDQLGIAKLFKGFFPVSGSEMEIKVSGFAEGLLKGISIWNPLPVIVTNMGMGMNIFGEVGTIKSPSMINYLGDLLGEGFSKAFNKIKEYGSGGLVKDTGLAFLHGGEYILNKKQYGGYIDEMDNLEGFNFTNLANLLGKGAIGGRDFIYELIKSPITAWSAMLESIGKGERFGPGLSFLEFLGNIPGPTESLVSKLGPLSYELLLSGEKYIPSAFKTTLEKLSGTKVLDYFTGLPARVFRGTKSFYLEENPELWDKWSLYGPGAYFTEDYVKKEGKADITAGYAGGNNIKEYMRSMESQIDVYKSDIKDIEKTINKRIAEIDYVNKYSDASIRASFGILPSNELDKESLILQLKDSLETNKIFLNKYKNQLNEFIDNKNKLGGPNIRFAYLDLPKLLNMEERMNVNTSKEFHDILYNLQNKFSNEVSEEFERSISSDVFSSGEIYVDDIYNSLNRAFGNVEEVYESLRGGQGTNPKEYTNKFLESIGYGGITHIGGKITGRESHKVYIAFNPENIYSYVENLQELDNIVSGFNVTQLNRLVKDFGQKWWLDNELVGKILSGWRPPLRKQLSSSYFKEGIAYQYGGHLPGYGGGDTIPAMLEPGEYVIRKEIVSKLGKSFFDKINYSSKYAVGGIAGDMDYGDKIIFSDIKRNFKELNDSVVMTNQKFADFKIVTEDLSESFDKNALKVGIFGSSLLSLVQGFVSGNPSQMINSGLGFIEKFASNWDKFFNGPLLANLFKGFSIPFLGIQFGEGGIVNEPVFGIGLSSGTSYQFGEKGKELVTPFSKINTSGEKPTFNPNIKIEVINDTKQNFEMVQYGTPRITNEEYIIGVFVKELKNNSDFGKTVNHYTSRRS